MDKQITWADMDYYQRLSVPENATESQIKQAFRKRGLIHHPDKGGDNEKFKDINIAKQVLCDPKKREKYDEHLKKKRQVVSVSCTMPFVSGPSPPWDDDQTRGNFGRYMERYCTRNLQKIRVILMKAEMYSFPSTGGYPALREYALRSSSIQKLREAINSGKIPDYGELDVSEDVLQEYKQGFQKSNATKRKREEEKNQALIEKIRRQIEPTTAD